MVGFIIAAVFVGICLILLWLTSDFLVDWLWFSSIGYPQVFWTTIGAKAVVLFAVWTGTAVILWLNGWLAVRFARRQRPQSVAAFVWNFAGNAPPPDLLVVMRDRLPWSQVIAGGAGLLALLVAAVEVGNWGVILQFFYHVLYGADDPLFNKDISFYLFVLPAYILIKNWMLLTLVLSGLFAANDLLGVWRHRIRHSSPIDVADSNCSWLGVARSPLRREGLVLRSRPLSAALWRQRRRRRRKLHGCTCEAAGPVANDRAVDLCGGCCVGKPPGEDLPASCRRGHACRHPEVCQRSKRRNDRPPDH